MPIFHFSLSNYGKKPILEFATNNHNIGKILRKILRNLTPKNEIRTFKDNEFIITIITSLKYMFSCITTPDFLIEKSIMFLQEAQNFYENNKKTEEDVFAFIKEKIDFYNSDKCFTKNQAIVKNLIDTYEIVYEDLAKILERDNKLNEIYNKTEKMASHFNNPQTFLRQQLIKKKKSEEKIKKKQHFYKNRKYTLILISLGIVFIIIFFFATYICGTYDFSSCY